MLFLRCLAFGLAIFALPACIIGKLVEPQVELEGIRVDDPSLTAATFIFDLRVFNPNSLRLRLSELDYQLNLNDKDFASGNLKPGTTVPAHGKEIVSLPVRIG